MVIGDKAGFIANALLFGYLNHAVSMYESRYATREDIDAAMRFGCGYPMGPLALLDLIGLDTAYEILDTMYRQSRDRLHAPAPDAQADGHRGAARPQDRPRLLHLRGARLARSSSTTTRRPVAGHHRSGARSVERIGVVGSGHDGDRHRRGARQGRVRRPVRHARRGEGRRACAQTLERSLDKAVLRGKLDEADRDEALGRVRGSARLDDLADRDLVIEAVVEELSVKQALFATFDEICKPGAVLATTTSSLPVIELRSRDRAARATS